jgi:hypothetical protein
MMKILVPLVDLNDHSIDPAQTVDTRGDQRPFSTSTPIPPESESEVKSMSVALVLVLLAELTVTFVATDVTPEGRSVPGYLNESLLTD